MLHEGSEAALQRAAEASALRSHVSLCERCLQRCQVLANVGAGELLEVCSELLLRGRESEAGSVSESENGTLRMERVERVRARSAMCALPAAPLHCSSLQVLPLVAASRVSRAEQKAEERERERERERE